MPCGKKEKDIRFRLTKGRKDLERTDTRRSNLMFRLPLLLI